MAMLKFNLLGGGVRCSALALTLGAACLACMPRPEVAQDESPPDKIRVLIIDGQNNHNWKETTRATRETLIACGRFEVDVATSPANRGAEDEWALLACALELVPGIHKELWWLPEERIAS